MTTMTEPEAIVCPAWCDHHVDDEDDQREGRLTHFAADLSFPTSHDGSDVFKVGLLLMHEVDGSPYDGGPLIDLNGPTFTPAQIRGIAAELVRLADTAEQVAPRWTVVGDFERNYLCDRGERTSLSGDYDELQAHADLLNATATAG